MRTLKRALAVFLACALTLSCVCLPAFAEGEPALEVSGIHSYDPETGTVGDYVSTVKAGDVVIADIALAGGALGAYASGYQFQLNFDKNMLELWQQDDNEDLDFYETSVTDNGTGVKKWTDPTVNEGDGYAVLAALYTKKVTDYTTLNSAVSADGMLVLVRIAFKVKADAESGSAKFSFDKEYDNKVIYYPKADSADTTPVEKLFTMGHSVSVIGVPPTLNSVTLDKDSVTVNGSDVEAVQAKAYSAKGTDITTGVIWSVSPTGQGVTIDAATGAVTVDGKAKAVEYTVTAAPNGTASQGAENKSAKFTVAREKPVATTIQVENQSIAVPTEEQSEDTVTFTATVLDQYGDPNGTAVEWSVSAPAGVSIDENGVVTVNNKVQAGTGTVTAKAGTATGTATLTITKDASVATKVTVSGDTTIAVPTKTEETAKTNVYNATVYDQFGGTITAPVKWSVSAADGVSINEDTGKVTVTNKAKAGTVTVTATSGTATGTTNLTITKATSEAAALEVYANGALVGGGTDTIGIPGSKDYTAVVYDQFGDEIKDAKVSFALSEAADGFSLSGGTLTVAGTTADNATAKVTVTSGSLSQTISVTAKEIEITWPAVTVKENPVYGDTWADIVTLSAGGSASVNGTPVAGTFTLKSTGIPAADTQTYVLNFKSDDGRYDVEKTGTVTIAPKEVSVVWTGVALTYNGDPQAPTAAVTSGLVGEDTLAVTVTGKQTDAGSYTAAASISDDNYVLNKDTDTCDFVIAPKPLTVNNGDLAIEKVYDGTAAVTSATGALGLTGVVDGDTVSVTYTTGSAYDSKTVGTGKTVTLTVALEGADKGNYTIDSTYAFTGAVITAKTVTVSGIAAADKVYDGTAAAALSYGALSIDGMADGDSLSATADGAFDSKTVDEDKTVAISNITLTGADAANYVLAESGNQTETTADITAKALTIEKGEAQIIKEYDGTTAPGTLSGELKLVGVVNGDTVSAAVGTVGDYPAAGYGDNYTVTLSNITLTGADAANYTVPATFEFQGARITKTLPTTALLNYTLADSTYTGNPQPVSVTSTADGLGAITVKYKLDGAFVDAPVDAGTYTVIASLAEGANYAALDLTLGTVTIAKADRALTVEPTSLDLVPGALTGTIVPTYANADGSAVVAYESSDTAAVLVTPAGKVTGVANGAADVTVSIDGTDNYNAASVTVAVKAVTEPITGVTVSGGVGLTAVVNGTTITVTGTVSAGTIPAYSFTTAGALPVTVSDIVDGKVTATVGGAEVVYTIDTSKVTFLPADIILEETVVSTCAGAEGIKDVLPQSVIDRVAAAAAADSAVSSVVLKVEVDAVETDGVVTYQVTYRAVGMKGEEPVELVAETALPAVTRAVSAYLVTGWSEGETDCYVKHTLTNGQVEYLPAEVGAGGVANFETADFSGTFEAVKNSDSVTITFHYNDGSVQTVTYTAADVGAALPTDSKSGYTFKGWTIGSAVYTTVTEALLALDDSAAEPSFSGKSGGGGGGSTTSKVTVTVSAATGVTVSPSGKVSVSKGDNQKFTITPKDGYVVTDILVDGKSVLDDATEKSGVYTYTLKNITAAHTLSVKAAKAEVDEWPFTDVADDFWAREAIEWAYDSGWMNGYSDTVFNPNGSVTRQQLWMILARLSGLRPADMAEARAWAMDSGVSDGSNPGTPVSRQQMVTILYRYAGLMGYKTTGAADISTFPDYASVGGYAQEGVAWAVGNGIVNGTADGLLNPAGTTTRAQFATILMRFCNNIVE